MMMYVMVWNNINIQLVLWVVVIEFIILLICDKIFKEYLYRVSALYINIILFILIVYLISEVVNVVLLFYNDLINNENIRVIMYVTTENLIVFVIILVLVWFIYLKYKNRL